MAKWSNASFSSAADLKAHLSSLEAEELEALQVIYHLSVLSGWSRTNGWLNIFLGGLTLWLGLTSFAGFTIPKLVQTIFGVLIVAQSLWALVSPNLAAIRRFGIVFLVAGIWNILLAGSVGLVGGAALTGLLGIAQLWWAFQTYKGYQRYQQMNLPSMQADVVQFYDEIWQAITRGVLKSDLANIHLWVGLDRWRGLLLEDKVFFALDKRRLLVVQDKDTANFVPSSSKPMRKRRVYGQIKLNAIFERAMMNQAAFMTYTQWKGEEAVLAEVKPSLWQRLPRVIRIILLIVAGLFLAYIAFILLGMIAILIQYS